ncbi:MAG: 5'/3'-nucleotidase SurE [Treponema sp.]|nr:5'/3'-nucleotidase SurE [Treponema sp.]
MNILLTNDDGVGSEGILKLADVLRSRKHRVYVIAPDSNRSGISHAISILHNPVKLFQLGEDTWSCTGTPADCVIAATLGALPEKPRLVLSGINRGANLGTDILYSGTAAAARQAGLVGIPAVALSLTGNYLDSSAVFQWDMAASWAADHLEELAALWRPGTFVNVNIPNVPGGPGGMLMAWPAVKHYHDQLTVMAAPDNSRWCFLKGGNETAVTEAGSDCDVVSRNFVSVSSVVNLPAVLKELCPHAPDYAAVAGRGGKKE